MFSFPEWCLGIIPHFEGFLLVLYQGWYLTYCLALNPHFLSLLMVHLGEHKVLCNNPSSTISVSHWSLTCGSCLLFRLCNYLASLLSYRILHCLGIENILLHSILCFASGKWLLHAIMGSDFSSSCEPMISCSIYSLKTIQFITVPQMNE